MSQDDHRRSAFNPLADLGVSEADIRRQILTALLEQECIVLPDSPSTFDGCGVYAIYYYGDHSRYESVSNERCNATVPIYVGKVAPSGTRTGHVTDSSAVESKLAQRLSEHRRSIEETTNLEISQFRCRSLALNSVWIRYAEQLLIETYGPWWNRYIDGFGLHDVGAGRSESSISVWDTIHPGRAWVTKRNLSSLGSPEDVWDNHVEPSIEAAKQNRTYKDRANIGKPVPLGEFAPAVEEASLFDFEG